MKVGQNIEAPRAGWTFDGNVADTFLEHVRRSVPLYEVGHDMIGQISDYFCHDDSVCYELGSSTGELTRKLAKRHAAKKNIRWVGIDAVEPMVQKAREETKDMPNVSFVTDDVVTFDYEKSDLIVSYYCVQFIAPRLRQELFNTIYERLNWSGAFLLFEKVRGPDARFQDMLISLYNEYKTQNGFNADEILNKTASLKGVLEPFSTEGNLGLLRRAGFTDIMTVMKYLSFEGFLAIK